MFVSEPMTTESSTQIDGGILRWRKFLNDLFEDTGHITSTGRPNRSAFMAEFDPKGTFRVSTFNTYFSRDILPDRISLEILAPILSRAMAKLGRRPVSYLDLESLIQEGTENPPIPPLINDDELRAEQVLELYRELPIDYRLSLQVDILKQFSTDLEAIRASGIKKIQYLLKSMLVRQSRGTVQFWEHEFPRQEFPLKALQDIHKGRIPETPLTESELVALEGVLSKAVCEVQLEDGDLDCLQS